MAAETKRRHSSGHAEPRHGHRWLEVGGARVFVRSAGSRSSSSGIPVVLVHGLSVSSRYMLPLAERLATNHFVCAPDLPGVGRSDKPPAALDVPALSGALLQCMRALALPKVALIGNSLGGQVVVELAFHHPEVVDRLVLLGPTVDAKRRTVWQQASRLVLAGLVEPWSLYTILLRDYLRAGPIRTLQGVRHALADRIEDKLPAITAPTLVVRGSRDAVVTHEWVEKVTDLLPNGSLATIEGGAHALNFDAPEQLADLVLPFLSGARRWDD